MNDDPIQKCPVLRMFAQSPEIFEVFRKYRDDKITELSVVLSILQLFPDPHFQKVYRDVCPGAKEQENRTMYRATQSSMQFDLGGLE